MYISGESGLFSEKETYQRALLHWTRAASQGSSQKQAFLLLAAEDSIKYISYSALGGKVGSNTTSLYRLWACVHGSTTMK